MWGGGLDGGLIVPINPSDERESADKRTAALRRGEARRACSAITTAGNANGWRKELRFAAERDEACLTGKAKPPPVYN